MLKNSETMKFFTVNYEVFYRNVGE